MRQILPLVLLATGACAPPAPQAAEAPEALVEQGRYLVTSVAFCGDCHTPWVDGRPDESRAFQGGPTGLSAPLAEYAPSIAGVPAHFTDEQFATFLQTGVRPDDSTALAPMPRYRLSTRDARAVTAYMRTIPRETEQR
jgi:mono/diheme cytochrome c family protein